MERHGADKRNARALASLRTRENAKYDGKEARKGARNREMIIRYYASPPCKFHAHLSFPSFRYTILPSTWNSLRKPTNFHLPKARTEEKEASFVSLLLSFFPTLSSLVRKIEDSRLTGNSADNPQSLASGQFRNQRR